MFTEYINFIQHQNSQRANSIFTNDVISIIYNYLFKIEKTEAEGISPVQRSKHTTVTNKIAAFSEFLNTISKNLSNNEVSQNVKYDLQKILVWIAIDYFTDNIKLISKPRKKFRSQNTDNDTVLAEQSDYVWDPEWSHPLFLNKLIDISSQAINTISVHQDYVKVCPLTKDATLLNYN